MRELYDNIGKKLPYQESDKYLENLINKTTENAIRQQNTAKGHWQLSRMIASAAAGLILLIGIGVTVFNLGDKTAAVPLQDQSPLDEFLNTLSDEEAAQLQYYEIEEIPEY